MNLLMVVLTWQKNNEDMDTSPRQEPLQPTADKVAPDFGVAEPQKSVKASGSSPCPPTNSNSPYYTNFPEFCYEQIPGSGIYHHQQQGMTYHGKIEDQANAYAGRLVK